MISFIIARPNALYFDEHCTRAINEVRGLEEAAVVESALHHAFDLDYGPNALADSLLVDVLEQFDTQDGLDVTTSLTTANQQAYMAEVALLEIQVGDVAVSVRRALQTTIDAIRSHGEVMVIENFKIHDSDSYQMDVVYRSSLYAATNTEG